MSQSWDNVVSMHDHLLTVHAHKIIVHAQTASCLGQDSTVRMRRLKRLRRPHPHSKQQLLLSGSFNGDVLALLERCYRTTDRYDKEQTSPLALLEARWLALALAPA